MRTLQGGFSKAFNRRWGRTGPLWQSRYQARLVDSQGYFDQLVLYIHLNPVRAGVVDDPAQHVLSGHRELLGRVGDPLLDIDDVLTAFGENVKTARRAYLKRVNVALAVDERAEVSGRLPWWTPERELRPKTGRAYVDELGRSTGRERRTMGAAEFVELACTVLAAPVSSLASSRKDPETTRLHQLVATIGIERWGQRAAELAALLGKHPDAVSRWARRGAERRSKDVDFAGALNQLDRCLAETPPAPEDDL